MGHALKGSSNARHVDIDKKRKLAGKFLSFGYGTTSLYHLEELYGKILSQGARIMALEKLRDVQNAIIQEQEFEMRKVDEKKNAIAKQTRVVLVAIVSLLIVSVVVLIAVTNPPLANYEYVPTPKATQAVLPITGREEISREEALLRFGSGDELSVYPTYIPPSTLSAPPIKPPFTVTVIYRGDGKTLNIFTEPNIFSDVIGQFNVGARVEVLEVLRVTEIIYDFSAEEDVIWYNIYGKVGEDLYVPLLFMDVYYTDWRL
jgi:hypothetical protein